MVKQHKEICIIPLRTQFFLLKSPFRMRRASTRLLRRQSDLHFSSSEHEDPRYLGPSDLELKNLHHLHEALSAPL